MSDFPVTPAPQRALHAAGHVADHNLNARSIAAINGYLVALADRPEFHGPVGLGNDTAAVQAALDGGLATLAPGVTYVVDPGLALPDDGMLLANGATLRRRVNGGVPLLQAGARCTVAHLTLDGNMTALGASTGGERGLAMGVQPTVVNVESYGHYGHGLRVDGDGVTSGGELDGIYSHDNGQTPGATGTADGLYLRNCMDVEARNVVATGNARTGVVATTGGPDAALSVGVRLLGVRADGNGYNDINTEHVTAPTIAHIRADGLVTFANSPRALLRDITAANISGVAADYPDLAGAYLTAPSSALSLSGKTPRVRDVLCEPVGVVSGNHVVIDPSDGSADLAAIRVLNANTAFVLGSVAAPLGAGFNAVDLDATSTGVRYKVQHAGGQSRPDGRRLDIVSGALRWRSAGPPAANTYRVGDTVERTGPTAGGRFGDVCVAAGTPGTWRAFGAIDA